MKNVMQRQPLKHTHLVEVDGADNMRPSESQQIMLGGASQTVRNDSHEMNNGTKFGSVLQRLLYLAPGGW